MVQLMQSGKILLLNGRDVSYWLAILNSAVSVLDGILEIVDATGVQQIPWRDYDMVILDGGAFRDLPATISQIQVQDPTASIVVFSSAPTWRQAREAMLAGAADYARKSLDREQVVMILKKHLVREA